MQSESEPRADAQVGVPEDDAAFAAEVAAAWSEGAAGWERLADAWDVTPPSASVGDAAASGDGDAASLGGGNEPLPAAGGAPEPCWWDGPPWYGQIAEEEFRAIVAAYVARYGVYTPDLPEREPELLRGWGREPEPGAAEPPQVAA